MRSMAHKLLLATLLLCRKAAAAGGTDGSNLIDDMKHETALALLRSQRHLARHTFAPIVAYRVGKQAYSSACEISEGSVRIEFCFGHVYKSSP